MISGRSWSAMGTRASVLVEADADVAPLIDLAIRRVALLEQCWSRFRPDSELSLLNSHAGETVVVSDDLLTLVVSMRDAWIATGGRFDPTVLSRMNTLGYDSDFAVVRDRLFPAALPDFSPTVGMGDVIVDVEDSSVLLPVGVGVDAGAIGKGLAADLVAGELYTAGVRSVLVDLGGDIAVRGWSSNLEGWQVKVESPEGFDSLHWLVDSDSFGVATSTTLTRRWAAGTRHHVIDPSTGLPVVADVVQATVVAGSAMAAETWATAAMMSNFDESVELLKDARMHGVLYTRDMKIEF